MQRTTSQRTNIARLFFLLYYYYIIIVHCRKFFDEATAPARACFAVAELPAGALLEIDAICIA
jgi:hypothetical protein